MERCNNFDLESKIFENFDNVLPCVLSVPVVHVPGLFDTMQTHTPTMEHHAIYA